jgi:hypothetical protein
MILRGWEDWRPQSRPEVIKQLVQALQNCCEFPRVFTITELSKAQAECNIRTWPKLDRSN